MSKIVTPERAKKFTGLPQGMNEHDRMLFVLFNTRVRGDGEFLVRVSSFGGVTFDQMGEETLYEGEGLDYIRSAVVMWRMAFNDFDTELDTRYDRPYLDSAKIKRVPKGLSNHSDNPNT